MGWTIFNDNAADAVTGMRIYPGERVFNTGKPNIVDPYSNHSRMRLLKEETIVWLAEQAGYTVSRNDGASGADRVSAGTPEPAPVVEREDADAGSGEIATGADSAGGRTATKRRSNGATKSK